jgi:hypothetical protein
MRPTLMPSLFAITLTACGVPDCLPGFKTVGEACQLDLPTPCADGTVRTIAGTCEAPYNTSNDVVVDPPDDTDPSDDTDPPNDTDPPDDTEVLVDTDNDTDVFVDTDVWVDTEVPPDTDVVPTEAILWIGEILDHRTIASIKYVEIQNVGGSAISLLGWSMQRFANGGTSPTSFNFPAVQLGPGETFVVANSLGQTAFENAYGTPDAYSSSANINGDDTVALVFDQEVMDLYGQIGVDGTGTGWEYTDSNVKRDPTATGPSPVFQLNQWVIIPNPASADPGSIGTP